MQFVLVVAHLAVAEALAAAFGVAGAWLPWLFIALAFVFPVTLLLHRRFKWRLIDWFYIAAAYWLGLIAFLFGAAVTFVVVTYVLYAAALPVDPALLGAVCFGVFLCVYLYATWKGSRVALTRISVTLPGLPSDWRGKKIVFMSDVHLGGVHGVGLAAKIARILEALRPEAIFIGGDLYDGGDRDGKELIEPFRAAVAEAPRGAYFVTGNHEYFLADPQGAFSSIRGLGVRILDNEMADLGGIGVVGVDYKKTHKRESFKSVLATTGVPQDMPVILLKHEPADLDVARDAGIALGFFGHTHYGQLFPFSYVARRIYGGFAYGLGSHGAMQTYTSSGAGTWGPPLRFGTKSEIVCVTLQ